MECGHPGNFLLMKRQRVFRRWSRCTDSVDDPDHDSQQSPEHDEARPRADELEERHGERKVPHSIEQTVHRMTAAANAKESEDGIPHPVEASSSRKTARSTIQKRGNGHPRA